MRRPLTLIFAAAKVLFLNAQDLKIRRNTNLNANYRRPIMTAIMVHRENALRLHHHLITYAIGCEY